MEEPTKTFRLIDVETGQFKDLEVAEYVVECYREQLARKKKRLGTAKSFHHSLEQLLEIALRDTMDFDRPLPDRLERAHAMFIAQDRNVQLPAGALKSKRKLHEFLKRHKAFTYCDGPREEGFEPFLGWD